VPRGAAPFRVDLVIELAAVLSRSAASVVASSSMLFLGLGAAPISRARNQRRAKARTG
jgi:hypothetical protein